MHEEMRRVCSRGFLDLNELSQTSDVSDDDVQKDSLPSLWSWM